MNTLNVRNGLGLAAVVCAATLCGGAAVARADTVTLKNGREIHGRLVEEKLDSIRIRTSGGTITIAKVEVATFSENENFGDYGLKPSTLRRLEEEEAAKQEPSEGGGEKKPGQTPPPGGKPSGGGSKATDLGKAQSADELLKAWAWAKDLTPEQIAQLTPQRDELLEKLRGLGPSKDAQLAALKLNADQERDLKERIQTFAHVRRQGGAGTKRQNALSEVLQTFGVKAIEQLTKGLESSNAWIQRTSAEGLGELMAHGDAARWAIFHFGAPAKLIALIDRQGDLDAAATRAEANSALEKIAGKGVGFKAGTEPMRTAAETQALRAWNDWWKTAGAAFERTEQEGVKQREALLEQLETVRNGGGAKGESEDEDL